MPEFLQYGFMVRAFSAGFAIAVIAPLIGHFLVVRRYSLIADTLAHIALAGVAIGLLVGTQPIVNAVVVTIAAGVLIEKLRANKRISGETVLAMFLPAGLSISLVLISLSNGFNVNLFGYLFGSISTVTPTDLWLILGLGVITLAVIGALYKQLFYTSFDDEAAKVSGIAVETVNITLIVLTAMTVSLAIRVVGVLLVGALMVIPVVTAMQLAGSFKQSIALAVGFALSSVLVGLILGYYFNLPAGAAIVLCSLALFAMVAILTRSRH
jgi:zinc transport system permease protein